MFQILAREDQDITYDCLQRSLMLAVLTETASSTSEANTRLMGGELTPRALEPAPDAANTEAAKASFCGVKMSKRFVTVARFSVTGSLQNDMLLVVAAEFMAAHTSLDAIASDGLNSILFTKFPNSSSLSANCLTKKDNPSFWAVFFRVANEA